MFNNLNKEIINKNILLKILSKCNNATKEKVLILFLKNYKTSLELESLISLYKSFFIRFLSISNYKKLYISKRFIKFGKYRQFAFEEFYKKFFIISCMSLKLIYISKNSFLIGFLFKQNFILFYLNIIGFYNKFIFIITLYKFIINLITYLNFINYNSITDLTRYNLSEKVNNVSNKEILLRLFLFRLERTIGYFNNETFIIKRRLASFIYEKGLVCSSKNKLKNLNLSYLISNLNLSLSLIFFIYFSSFSYLSKNLVYNNKEYFYGNLFNRNVIFYKFFFNDF